ncbi:MAG: LssY C-terminal domain-containing protein, partial [Myxococcales bacterium]|nr:LssY C-terminal domain-containing protein [Myxococcales bacterium]
MGTFEQLLEVFTRAGWDETEVIDVGTSFKTAVSFLFGSSYRYSPVSNLYLFGRKQDVAFQKARETNHERNHLRLWLAPDRLEGLPVWVGQVSRDIGVRFTTKTWNLTTHKIDPDVDDSRENVMSDLLQTQRVARMGYASCSASRTPKKPGRNLTGDPYFTDGSCAVAELSDEPTEPTYFEWGDADPMKPP